MIAVRVSIDSLPLDVAQELTRRVVYDHDSTTLQSRK